MGALTITTEERGINGNKRWIRGTIAFSSSYSTGGDTGLTALALGIDIIEHVTLNAVSDYNLEYVYSSGNVLAHYGDYNEVSDGAFNQVANAVNLSTPLASVRFMAMGI